MTALQKAESIRARKGERPIAVLTAYDYPTARLLDESGVDVLLVGDSLGMVVLGFPDTTHVTLAEMEHHIRAVARAQPRALRAAGFSVNHVDRGETALVALRTAHPDILILDLGLPGMDGLEVLRTARREQFTNPVLILTARDSTRDKVSGLDAGADDYLAKPFEIAELLARLRALERRLGSVKSKNIVIGDVTLDTHSLEVTVASEPITMSRREYMLLKSLMESANKVQTREMLDSKLYSWGEEVSSNTVEVHIHNLRKKLPVGFIQTIRGVGYVIKKQAG